MTDQRLDEIATRIEGLVAGPEGVRAPLTRFVKPLLKAIGYRPKLKTEKITALLDLLRTPKTAHLDWRRVEKRYDDAVDELENNITGLERTLVVYGRVPLAHAAWVRRLYEVTVRASRAALDEKNEAARRVAAAIESVRIAAPLAIVPRPTPGQTPTRPSALQPVARVIFRSQQQQ